ncbi:hypothetical protein CFR78_10355 [Komagataeibacter rhaeticus]|nr:hypothetical protein CFR78_10355 [Komagataeibacter rhaeticus]
MVSIGCIPFFSPSRAVACTAQDRDGLLITFCPYGVKTRARAGPSRIGVVKARLFCYGSDCVVQEVFLARLLPVLGLCAIMLSLAACATNTPGSVKDRSTWARWGYAEGLKNVASH